MLALMLEQTASQLVFSRLTAKSARKWPAPRMAQPLLRLWKAWSNATVPRWSVTCCLVCRVRMRKPGRRSGYCPRYRSRRRRSLCAQCPAQYTAGQSQENGRTTVPSPAERRDLYLQGCDFMDDAGWRCISNSHWGRTTRERNLYNLLIKQGADCLAFGSGAGGSINGYSWMNERNLQTWHESVAAGKNR